jgi:short-subunit dehydrogenase
MTYRAALVTGASSGIGEAFARLLPAGTDLLLTGRQEAPLRALVAELSRPGRRVDYLLADFARAGAIEAVIDAAEAFGVDLVINNAGLGNFAEILGGERTKEAEMVLVNVVAPTVLTNALLPGMLRRAEPQGRRAGIIIVASVVSFFPVPGMTTYAATKAFDLMYALGLAEELRGRPVDVLALCPGSTTSRFAERAGSPTRLAALGHSSQQVAAAGLAALGRRRLLVVGLGNRFVVTLGRLLPFTLFARLVRIATRWR